MPKLNPEETTALRTALRDVQSAEETLNQALNTNKKLDNRDDAEYERLSHVLSLYAPFHLLRSAIGGALIDGTTSAYIVAVENVHGEPNPLAFAVSSEAPRKLGDLGREDDVNFSFLTTEDGISVIMTLPSHRNESVYLTIDGLPWEDGSVVFAAFSTLEKAQEWSQNYTDKKPRVRPDEKDLERNQGRLPQDILYVWY